MTGKIIQKIRVVINQTNHTPVYDNGTGTLELNGVRAHNRDGIGDWFPGDKPVKAEIIVRLLK